MPALVVDAIGVAGLLGLLGVAFAHPRGRVEVAVGLLAVAAVTATGATTWHAAGMQVDRMLPVALFLVAILVVAETCAAQGLFDAVGALVRRRDATRTLGLTFVAAIVVTAVLSLDATVVLLTPVVIAAAAGGRIRRPLAHTCVRLANSASLLLPVSNLTNILALPHVDLTFLGWAGLMAPVWLVVIVVEYVGIRTLYRHDLVGVSSMGSSGQATAKPMPRFPVAVVALMLVGFAVASPLGIEPFWVAGAAALVCSAHSLRSGRMSTLDLAHSTHLPFAAFVLCLAVVVDAIARGFLGEAVADVVPSGGGLLALLGIALLATALANVINNLPATLLLLPLLAPLGTTAVMAALIGLNVGSGLTYPGSLANLLWRRVLVRRGEEPPDRRFHVHALLVTPIAVVSAVVTLWVVS